MQNPGLPIESDRELLAEYGRTFAWITLIEYLLEQYFLYKSKLLTIDPETRQKLMRGKMLGQKIDLAKHLLPDKMVADLKRLNEYRVTLAHGVISQEVLINGVIQQDGGFVVDNKKGERLTLDKGLTDKVIKLAQEISSELHSLFQPSRT